MLLPQGHRFVVLLEAPESPDSERYGRIYYNLQKALTGRFRLSRNLCTYWSECDHDAELDYGS